MSQEVCVCVCVRARVCICVGPLLFPFIFASHTPPLLLSMPDLRQFHVRNNVPTHKILEKRATESGGRQQQ
ncbi:hypothetical protein QBC44DRAFT_325295 [Cladorrhinum sp. PSN332]|nr:hypothetical protein QBC44DRAFT_325295 [Cladorrhinum sp. PSN332]